MAQFLLFTGIPCPSERYALSGVANGERGMQHDEAPAPRGGIAPRGLPVWSGRRALCFVMIASAAGWAVVVAVLWMTFG